jgi:uncharacterized membrane protein
MNDFLTFIIFVLGLITVVLSVIVSFKFNYYKKHLTGSARRLSSAVSWQLIGEAIIGFGTLIFAAAAFFDVLQHWSIELQSSLRFAMFFATSLTTIHLFRTLKTIAKD